MSNSNFSHAISPDKILRGEKAWEKGKTLISAICNRPLIIGRSKTTRNLRKRLDKDIREMGLETSFAELKNDCCELDLNELAEIAINQKCNGVIAAGGGKVLDAGKLLADRLSIPCITVPLSASTCAGWTALSNLYTPDGAFLKDFQLRKCPELLIFDHPLIRNAPKKTLASGIADALAKWYEASLTSSASKDGLVQQAVQLARVLRDQLFIDGCKAINDPLSQEWIRVSEGCALTAGLIGGIGGAKCRTAIAHPMHNGLTQLQFKNKPLHGEIVGFGLVVQLELEDNIKNNQLTKQSKKQLIDFLNKINIPTRIESLELSNPSIKELVRACKFACKEGSDIHKTSLEVDEKILFNAISKVNEISAIRNSTHDVIKNNT